MKFYVETLGCWLNKADSELIAQRLTAAGHERVQDPGEADLVVLNTCAVRQEAEESAVRFLKRVGNSGKRVVASGCLVKVKPSRLREADPDVVLIDLNGIEAFDALLDSSITWRERPMKILPEFTGARNHIHVVPIQVGCMGNCAFCATKLARGGMGWVKSYDLETVVSNVRRAVQRGAREIYLTGQETSAYGKDKGYDLVDLLESILSIDGRFFIRMGMMEPLELDRFLDRLIDIVKSDWRIYRFFHIPVQSGSDRVLKIMRRKYEASLFREEVMKIRRAFPDSTIATDIIVGHPGEEEEDFMESLQLIKELEIDKVHVARFSPRPGTEAAAMKQIPDAVKKARSKLMGEEALKVSLARNRKFIGSTFNGIVSQPGYRGRGFMVRIGNYRPVIVEEASLSTFVTVSVDDATPIHLRGRVVG